MIFKTLTNPRKHSKVEPHLFKIQATANLFQIKGIWITEVNRNEIRIIEDILQTLMNSDLKGTWYTHKFLFQQPSFLSLIRLSEVYGISVRTI